MKKLSFENRFLFIQSAGFFLLALATNTSFVSAQNEPRYTRIASLEASNEMKAYQKDLGSGAPFAEKHQQLLLNEGLPQLFIDGNRLDRAQVRQRLQKIFFESIADSNAHKKATDTAIKQLSVLARSEQISINGSINAALFLGELRGRQGELLTTALQPLSEIVSDNSVTPSVRIAALTGLKKRAQALKASVGDSTLSEAETILPALNTILGLSADSVPPIGRNWMQGQALNISSDMLAVMDDSPQKLEGIIKNATTILKDSNRPIDLRIRAVVFLANSTRAGITLPTNEVLPVAEELVKESLRDAYGIIQDKKFEEEITGFSDMDMGGGGPEMMGYDAMGMPVENEKNYLPITYFVRASWRLVTLADAMPRLAEQLDNNKEEYEDRSKLIRSYGVKLYEEPKDASLISALETFDPESIVPEADDPEPEDPDKETAPKKFSPFKLR
ncbi:MAG: hypothetical protein VYA49_05590 [Planctomycetota bacterium]|nr:hypothetical protein [Planctomycetota bacterium]